MAQVYAVNIDKAIKAIKQAIACHGFCGSEVPWKIKLTGWPTCRGQGLLLKAKDLTLKAKAKNLTFKAKDSKFVLEDTSRPRTTTLHISSQCRCHTYDVTQSDSPGGSTGPEWSLMSGIVLFFSRHILRQTAVQKWELSSSDM